MSPFWCPRDLGWKPSVTALWAGAWMYFLKYLGPLIVSGLHLHTGEHTNILRLPLPVPRAFKPVQDVGAARVVNLIKGMWVWLLHSHWVAGKKSNNQKSTFLYCNISDGIPTLKKNTNKLPPPTTITKKTEVKLSLSTAPHWFFLLWQF